MSTASVHERFWRKGKVRLMHMAVRHSLKRQLKGVYTTGAPSVRPDVVTAYVCNHSGRWDGFAIWQERFNARSEGKHLSVVLEESFDRYWIFRGSGAIPVSPGSISSVRELMHVLRDVLRPGDSVALFPQGHIYPGDKLPLEFKSLTRVLARLTVPVVVVPTAIATEMLHLEKPALFISFGSPVPYETVAERVRDIEALVTQQVTALRARLNALGEHAPTQFQHA